VDGDATADVPLDALVRTSPPSGSQVAAAWAGEEIPRRNARRAILVAGMHRSGTSALTRVLSLLGARLPANVTPPIEGDNGSGFWEPLRIAQLHDEVLASAGLTWHDVSSFPRSWYASDGAFEFKRRLLALLVQEFGDSRLFVIKDPRLCRVLPLWIDPLTELRCDPRFVLPFRNPLEVAASLQRRDGFSLAHGLLLWLRHVVDAERATRAFGRTFVSYAHVLEDWRKAVSRIATELELDWPEDFDHVAPEIEGFLSPELRHFWFTDASIRARGDIVVWVKDAYSALEEAEAGNHVGAVETFSRLGATLDEADVAYGPLLSEEHAALERELAGARIRASATRPRAHELEKMKTRRGLGQRVLNRATPHRRS
jgi:hypothetical protein